MRYIATALSWAGVTALSLVLAFIAMEAVLRHSSISAKIAPERYLFVESPQHFRDQHSEFGYSAFSQNRELAVYSDESNAWIEYDALFTVNNAGLVQRRDIDSTRRYIVVVGDSFTQGQGASPWFYELERDLPDLPLANLGILGTGVQHWEKAVDWFEKRVAPVDSVVIVFIRDNFFRSYWFAKTSPSDTRFCYEDSCFAIYTKLLDRPPSALAQYRRELLKQQDVSPGFLLARSKELLMKTQTGNLVVNLVRRVWSPRRQRLEANKRSLEGLQARHKVALVLHLPEKEEAAKGAWSIESLELRSLISGIKLRYVDGMDWCGLDAADFRKFDAHPNPAGYRKIQKCVGALLKTASSVQAHRIPD